MNCIRNLKNKGVTQLIEQRDVYYSGEAVKQSNQNFATCLHWVILCVV